MRIPFGVRSYQLDSMPVSAQRLVNWYPEVQPPDANTKVALIPCEGLLAFATTGSDPIKGMIEMGGMAYVMSGRYLYSVTSTGTSTLIGGITIADRYSMQENGTQIVIGAGADCWIYDTTNGLRQITASGFLGADLFAYQDGYFIGMVPDTGQFQVCTLYDGTAWDAADVATAEGDPDNLVSLISDHLELWLFGSKTTEVWQNTGAAAFPFERLTYMERGCGARNSVAKVGNSVFWLDEIGIVRRAQGYQPVQISDHGVEQTIASMSDFSDAVAFTYSTNGHEFYVLIFPTGQACFVYDVASGMWHERETKEKSRYRANAYVRAFGKDLVGDYESGSIYELDSDTYTDAGDEIVRIATSPAIGSYEQKSFFGKLNVEFDMGKGLTSGQGSDPQAMLEWSDDGGRTWSNIHYRSIGQKGEYGTRAIFRRLGGAYKRIFRLSVSDPIKAVFLNAYAN